jgi:hypothetical protein
MADASKFESAEKRQERPATGLSTAMRCQETLMKATSKTAMHPFLDAPRASAVADLLFCARKTGFLVLNQFDTFALEWHRCMVFSLASGACQNGGGRRCVLSNPEPGGSTINNAADPYVHPYKEAINQCMDDTRSDDQLLIHGCLTNTEADLSEPLLREELDAHSHCDLPHTLLLLFCADC